MINWLSGHLKLNLYIYLIHLHLEQNDLYAYIQNWLKGTYIYMQRKYYLDSGYSLRLKFLAERFQNIEFIFFR